MTSTPPEATSAKTRSVLRHRDFRLLFTGQVISTVGDQLFPVAVAIKVLDSGGDAGDLGLVLASRWLALVLLVLVGGVWADRLPRTLIMIGADVFRAVVVLGLALSPSDVPVWLLASLVFAVGGGEAVFRPAFGALTPSLVPAEEIERANALTAVYQRSATVIGPAVAGVVVGLSGGVRVALLVDAATFLASMLTLSRIRESRRERRAAKQPVLTEAIEGVRQVWRQPWAFAVISGCAVQLMFTVAPWIVLLPIISRERLGGDRSFGFVLAAQGLGGVLGALAAGRIRPRRPGLVSLLGLFPVVLELLVLLYDVPLATVMLAAFLCGAAIEPFAVYWSTALMREFHPDVLARVVAVDWLGSFALLPLGLVLCGGAIELIGREAVLWLGIAVQVVTTVAMLAVRGTWEFANPRPDAP